MSAMEGGSVACFASPCCGGSSVLMFGVRGLLPPPLSCGVVSRREDFPQSRQFFAWCSTQKKGVGGRKCGAPPKFEVVWAGLNGRSHAFREYPISEVWVGRPGPIYRDGTWRM